MSPTGLHHIDLVVSSIDRSLPFYRELLEPLGYTRVGEVEGERVETIWYLVGTRVGVGLREAQTEGAYDRYRVGVHHVAFEAASRDVVDERHRWLVERRGATTRALRRSTATSRGTTPSSSTTFFYDPDGIKLEIVHVPER